MPLNRLKNVLLALDLYLTGNNGMVNFTFALVTWQG
jgi:hypothetical protein